MANFYAKYPAGNPSSVSVTTVQGEGTAGTPVGGILTIQGDPSGAPVPISGSITASNPSIGVTGAAVPADATYVGMNVSGNLTGLVGTASGLKVDGSAVTQPISAVSLPLPTGAATEASLAKLTLTQGSTTSGQSGALTQGAVTTSAPSYTTAQTSPLSLTTAGALRVDASASTQPVSGTVAVTQSTSPWVTSASQSGTWNITNVSGTVSLPTGASTEASLVKLPLAQGSTTSGQSGILIQGAVTTAAPSYTTAQTSSLSLTTGGALRVDASASTQPVSGTIAATQSGTWTVQPGNTANTTPWLVTGSGTAGTAATGVVTVQGIASGTALTTTSSVAAATFQDGAILFSSLTTNFATVVTTGGIAKVVQMRNNTNAVVLVSLDSGSTTAYTLDSGDQVSVDLKSNGMSIATSTTLQAKYSGGAPTSGSIRVNVVY